MQLLVRVCRELQTDWGDRPFFLSARTAAEILGTDAKSAWRQLLVLQFDGLIKLDEKGKLRGRRANTWRFMA